MATRPNVLERHPPILDPRLRRLCWVAIVAAVLLGIYVAALSWATRELQAGVERSIQPLPALIRDRPEN